METAEQLVTVALQALAGSLKDARHDLQRLERYMDGLRDEIADLDHAKAARAQVDALHSRIDEMESKR